MAAKFNRCASHLFCHHIQRRAKLNFVAAVPYIGHTVAGGDLNRLRLPVPRHKSLFYTSMNGGIDPNPVPVDGHSLRHSVLYDAERYLGRTLEDVV